MPQRPVPGSGSNTDLRSTAAPRGRATSSRAFANPADHITPLRGSELWQVGLLELWLQSHGIQGA